MRGRRMFAPVLLAAPLASAGCVSRVEHDLALSRIEVLEVRRAELTRKVEEGAGRTASAEARVRELEAESADRAKRLAAAEESKEKLEKERDDLASHRDELKEWVERDLLPVAEQHDPRLANLKAASTAMAEEVARLRGLPWKHDVMRRLVTRTEVGEWMRRDMKKELPEDKAREIVLVGAEMGLCRPGTDLYGVVSQFLEAGALAFYKPDTRTFYHIEGNDGRGAYPVVFHELVHALEDQHFDLDALNKAIENDSDRSLALRGLTEGTASLFQDLYEQEHPEDAAANVKAMLDSGAAARQGKMFGEVPPFLIASFGLYPYQNGKEWCRTMGARDPAVAERLFREPPVSTEQVLHPEKFAFDGPRDWPHAVAEPELGDVLGKGWKALEGDTLGELVTGVLLTQLQEGGTYGRTLQWVMSPTGGLLLKRAAKKAVEGWDGDRYAVWIGEASEHVVVVWSTVWDSDGDAKEFADAYAPLLGWKVTGTKDVAVPAPVRFADAATGRVSGIELEGRRVVTVLGAPAEKFDALLARGFAAPVTPDARDAADAPAPAAGTESR